MLRLRRELPLLERPHVIAAHCEVKLVQVVRAAGDWLDLAAVR
jgi:hypothetical protein